MDDNYDYANRIKYLRQEEQHLIDGLADNVHNEEYMNKFKSFRREEHEIVDKLLEEVHYLSEESKIDPLTGLYNRKILPKIRQIGAVIMCDIDNFKGINDSYGHAVGDDALKAVGQAISKNIRIGDIGCRFGGDEFVIVFTTDLFEVIDNRMKKIVEDVNRIIKLPHGPITMSIGVAFNKDGVDLDDLMKKADSALYQSKENGKNQITYYERQMTR